MAAPGGAEIVHLNVGGKRFSTSHQTLTWIPDSFFSSLLSGRISTLRDESGAIFIDRDPSLFAPILNFLRTKELDPRGLSLSLLLHEAQFYGITPLVRRLQLREELDRSCCGGLLFSGYLPPPALPGRRRSRHSLRGASLGGASLGGASLGGASLECANLGSRLPAPLRRSQTLPPRQGALGPGTSPGTAKEGPGGSLPSPSCGAVRVVCGHHNWIAVAYAHFLVCYRMQESSGWHQVFCSPRLDWHIEKVALNAKVLGGALGDHDKMVAAAAMGEVLLWALRGDGSGREIGLFQLGVPVDSLFFVANQLIGTSHTGKIGVWNAVTKHWQVQEVVPISSSDAAGTFLLLGCSNGSIYYLDVQKFPLRMKDNDLLVPELFRDPSRDAITALSLYLTPRASGSGSWLEVAYGTAGGLVRVIAQHPETLGGGPQLFQTLSAHRSPVTRVRLGERSLVSVCADNNHVRSWTVPRFRGMLSTQPGSTPLASFRVLALDDGDGTAGTDIGPFGEQDEQQLFIQRLVPESGHLFVLLSSTGQRVCEVRSVDSSPITAFTVHECEGCGCRPRRALLSGHANGSLQLWDLSTALDALDKPTEPVGLSEAELLRELAQCELEQRGFLPPPRRGGQGSLHSPPPPPPPKKPPTPPRTPPRNATGAGGAQPHPLPPPKRTTAAPHPPPPQRPPLNSDPPLP